MRVIAIKGEVGPDKMPSPTTVRHQSKIYGDRYSNTSIDNRQGLQGEKTRVRLSRLMRTEETE
jgi:hypothetical protein